MLPIVMLALGFQLRAREILWQGGRLGMKTALLVLLLGTIWVLVMGWAEISALFSLADDRNESYTWVATGAGIGCVILVVGTLDAVINQLVESFQADRKAEFKEAVERVVRDELNRAVETEIERRSQAKPPDERGDPEYLNTADPPNRERPLRSAAATPTMLLFLRKAHLGL